MRESVIENYLVRRVKELGGEVRKVQWIGRRGAPDRFIMLPAGYGDDRLHNIVWVELKAPGKEAEAHQIREHERLRKYGMQVEVVDSCEAVDDLLESLKC